MFIKWLYTQSFPSDDEDWIEDRQDIVDETAENDWCRKDERARFGACVLGDRLQATAYRRAAEMSCVDYFVGKGSHACEQTIIFAFANLLTSSPLLQMLVDLQCAYFDRPAREDLVYQTFRHDIPKDFLLGVMERHAEFHSGKDWRPLQQCDYHGHVSNEERLACPESTASYDSSESELDSY